MIIPIDNADDPRIAGYRQVKERDLVGRDGLFVAEGAVVLRHLLTSPLVEPVSLLIAESKLPGLFGLLDQVPAGIPVYGAGQGVIDAIAGFHLHRGILALGRRIGALEADDLLASLPARALVVVLFGIGNHDNMGGLFRNAAAFGADAVLLAEDCCDPMYRKAIRVSVGGALTVAFARLPDGDPIALLERHGFTCLALSPAGAEPLHALVPPPRAALLLGAEGPGLPDAILARARTVSIPMAGKFDSLNVATSSGIALHQLAFG